MTRKALTSVDKSKYSRPTLLVYGAIAELTATGTITTNENSGSMMANMG
ncbi:MAG: hypothetical protein V4696_00265 [Pseudomonadota bacterium]